MSSLIYLQLFQKAELEKMGDWKENIYVDEKAKPNLINGCPRSRKLLLQRCSTAFSKSNILLCSTSYTYKRGFVINYPLKEPVGNEALQILPVTDTLIFVLLQTN